MAKKSVSVFLALLLVFAHLPVFADSGDVFYEAYTDGWNSSGISREGQANALRMKIEQPWEYIGKETDYSANGGEGVLPQNWKEYSENGACVYWIQSAVFPEGDMYVQSAEASQTVEGYIFPQGGTNLAIKAANYDIPEFKGSIKLTTKVRFDDYNAERYLFTLADRSTGSTVYNDFFWFDPNGKLYILCYENGIAATKELMEWTAGEWYTVSLTINFDASAVSVDVNGERLLSDKEAQGLTSWTMLYPIRHKQKKVATDTRIFANSYVSGVEGRRVASSSVPSENGSYYFALDFTWNKSGVSRMGQDKAVQQATRQPWNYTGTTTATNVGADGQLPFGDEYKGAKNVYLIRTAVWPDSDTEKIPLADNTSTSPHYGIPTGGTASAFYGSVNKTELLLEAPEKRKSETLHWQTKVRFDDTNSVRKVFSMGYYDGKYYNYTDFLSFNKDKTFSVTYKNGSSNAVNSDFTWEVGKWYTIDLTMRLNSNTFSVSFNGDPVVTNVAAPCSLGTWDRLKYLEQIQNDSSATITEREFSNAYIDYITAEYLEDSPLFWATLGEVKNDNGAVSADVSFTNIDTLSGEKKFGVLLALYEDDKLFDIAYKSVSLPSPKTKTVSVDVSGESGKAYTAKLLAFDDAFAPLAEDSGVVTHTQEYYYIIDFEDNNSGYSRQNQNTTLVLGRTKPWTFGETTTAKTYGTEGMLPFEERFIAADKRVYWIKTGIWPTDDTEEVKLAGDISVGIPKKGSPAIVLGNSSPLLRTAEERSGKTAVWELSLRMDDFNSQRNLFSMNYSGSSWTNFISFNKDGTFTVKYKESGSTKTASASWSTGTWYKVKLIVDYDANTFSLFLGDTEIVNNKEAICDLDGAKKIIVTEQSHQTNSADITSREFSNTFVEYLKAYYEE